jgi:electron transfer flavoprotein alpha subunit
MATVREGVMKKEILDPKYKGKVVNLDVSKYVSDSDFVVEIIERHMEKSKLNIKGSPIIVAGGYGVGSKENFRLLYDLAEVLGGEVGASRAAIDAGYVEHERQIGQTGLTVRPKLYIACGISGQIQHRAGMEQSAQIIAINTDPEAPINSIADYVITGDIADIIPKMIKYYKKNTK